MKKPEKYHDMQSTGNYIECKKCGVETKACYFGQTCARCFTSLQYGPPFILTDEYRACSICKPPIVRWCYVDPHSKEPHVCIEHEHAPETFTKL